MVSGDNKERGKIDKEDDTPPTAALKSVISTPVIDKEEGTDVEIIDRTNKFIQTRIEDE